MVARVRRWTLVAVLAAVVLGVVWLLSGDDVEPSANVDDAVVADELPPPPPKPAEAKGARVSGIVLRDGQPVANARVSLKASTPLVTLTLDDGRFLFDDVPSGAAFLAASNAEGASEVLGPYQLTPGGAVEGVTLTLSASVKIAGRVIDLLTQKPIAGAQIVSPVSAVRTDAEGRFALTGAKAQTWLDVMAPGFLSRTEWVSLELANSGGLLELVLTPSSWIEGTVQESGVPVAAATVWGEFADGARHGARSMNVFTDKDGKFRLECGAGSYALSAVTVRGIRVKGPLVRVGVGETKTGVVLDTGDVSSATGTVTRVGQPVSGAQVMAVDALTEDVAGIATSAADGTFRFDGLSLGKYVLQVRAGPLNASAGPFEHRGDGMPWTVALSAGAELRGRVEPPSGGVVVRWRSGSWSGPSAQTVTDLEGTFRFEGLPDEPVTLDAEGPTGAATATARAGDEVVLKLKRGTVIVQLRDDTGKPISDGVIAARSIDTGTTRRQFVLAPDGVARLELAYGRWSLSLEVAGRGRSANVEVVVGEGGAQATLMLESSLAVSGRVIARGTSAPVNGARVESFAGEPGRVSRVSVLTDARGEFLLPPVPRSANLRVARDGFVEQWRRAADGPRWDVSLEPMNPGQGQRPEFEQFEGVGMTLDAREGPVRVALVSEGSPAERAGVQAGDVILAVDGQSVAGQNLNAVVARIRGPAGTPVAITFQRSGREINMTIRRKLLTL